MQQKRLQSNDHKFSAAQTLLEEKRATLENKLSRDLDKKHMLELRINGQFEEIKAVEMAIEKMNGGGLRTYSRSEVPSTRFSTFSGLKLHLSMVRCH